MTRCTTERIARFVDLSFQAGQYFALRLLLLYRPARSLAELLTVDGQVYETPTEAARVFGLMADGQEVELALDLAVQEFGEQPRFLRHLFCMQAEYGAGRLGGDELSRALQSFPGDDAR